MQHLINKANKLNWYDMAILVVISLSLRYCLEFISDRTIPSFEKYNDFTAWWIATLTTLTIVIAILAKVEFKVACQLATFCFPIILLVPIIDIPTQFIIGQYHQTFITENLTYNFLTFYGPIKKTGATVGQRIEILLIIITTAYLVWYKTKSYIRTIITILALHSTIFVLGMYPKTILNIWALIGNKPNNAQLQHANTLILWIHAVITTLILTLPKAKQTISQMTKDGRWSRTLTYCGILTLGYLSNKSNHQPDLVTTCELIAANIAIIFACQFCIVTNNLADKTIDEISNPQRPTITGKIKEEHYKIAAIFCLIISTLLAISTNTTTTLFTIGFITIYTAYSNHPIRLKKFPIISKLAIGLAATFCFSAGIGIANDNKTHQFNPNIETIQETIQYRDNTQILWFFFVGFGLASNIIDLKDTKGDKKDGIKTLPILLGQKKAQYICVVFVTGAYIWFPFAINNTNWLIATIPTAIISNIFLLQKNYDEKWIIRLQATSFWIINLSLIT